MLSAGCAPTMQSALSDVSRVEAPAFDIEGQTFTSFDGARLGLTAWTPPKDQKTWAVIVGLHGMNDYARTFSSAGPWFAARGVATFAYDARGFGRSPQRGVWPGQALMTRDLDAAIAAARQVYPNAILAVVGESMGAAETIAAFSGANPPRADRLVLVSPAVWGWSTMPDLYAVALWGGAHIVPGRQVSPPRNLDIMPSDNIEMLRALARDPLMLRRTRIDSIYGLVDLMETASDHIGAIEAPTAFLYGAHDEIIPRKAALRAARNLSPDARTALYSNGYHMMLRDLSAGLVYQDILTFLRDPEAAFPSGAPPLLPRPGGSAVQAVR
jgi:alpha-beta hydrolase superfamily lysophospholipase